MTGRAHAIVVLAAAALAGGGAASSHAADRPPTATLAEFDAAFAASVTALARRAEALGDEPLAELLRSWDRPEPADRQVAVVIPPRLERPAWIEAGPAAEVWDDFVSARRRRAAGSFEHALAAARAHRHEPGRAEQAAAAAVPAAERPPVPQRSSAALRLVYRTLRDDPDHDRARAAAGYVRRGDVWAWPQAARRLDRGEEYDAAFGWLPRGRLARYRAGERHDRGRWMTTAEDAARPLTVERGRRFDTDHWQILSPAPLEAAAALAVRLEETFLVWQQVLGTLGTPPAAFEKRLTSRSPPPAPDPFAAVLCADRRQYVAELSPQAPTIEQADGLYWMPTRTAWFFHETAADAEPLPRDDTVRHEATHQLCVEAGATARTSPLAGERCGFWVIEALACYMESIRPIAGGWTVGGRDAGRVPRARELLVNEAFQVPLEEFTAASRADFQARPRLEDVYAQGAALADFFMNGAAGRYREAFLEYSSRVYSGTADPETLARLCRTPYPELDAAFRAFLRGE